MYAKRVVDNICESERIQPTMTHAHSRGQEVTWTGSHVDRKSRGQEVTWTGSHVDRKSRGPEVTRRTGSHTADRKSRGGPEVTWTGSHVDRKSHAPEVTWTGSHVDRTPRQPRPPLPNRRHHFFVYCDSADSDRHVSQSWSPIPGFG